MTTQPLEALALANEVRCTGRRIRREMNALPIDESRKRAAELLRNPPPQIARMRVGLFLTGIHRYGPEMAQRALRAASLPLAWDYRIGPIERLSDRARPLSERQRLRLADVLEGK